MRSRAGAQPKAEEQKKASEQNSSPTPRQAILDVAVRLFGEQGYNATTMRDIAKAVGILPGSLYAHIDSKETLLIEIVEKGIERFLAIDRLLAASEESPQARMRIAILEHVKAVAESPERNLVVFHQWRFLSGPNRTRAMAMRRRYAKAFMKIMADGIASGDFNPKLDARIAVFGILGALNWTPEWFSPSGPMSAEEVGQKMADSLINGLLPGGRSTDVEAGEAPARKRLPGAKTASAVSTR